MLSDDGHGLVFEKIMYDLHRLVKCWCSVRRKQIMKNFWTTYMSMLARAKVVEDYIDHMPGLKMENSYIV